MLSAVPGHFILSDKDPVTRDVLRDLKTAASEKRADHDWWGVDGFRNPRSRPYDYEFESVLPGKIEAWIAHRAPVHALDLFGSGIPVDNVQTLGSNTGVRLLGAEGQELEPRDGHIVIGADLFRKTAWRRLFERMRSGRIDSFDLITVRPVGAFTHYQHELAGTLQEIDPRLTSRPVHLAEFNRLYVETLRLAYQLLNPQGGVILFQLPIYEAGDGHLDKFVEALRGSGVGVRVDHIRHSLAITRGPRAPAHLPDYLSPRPRLNRTRGSNR